MKENRFVWWQDFWLLLFPRLCASCHKRRPIQYHCVCLHCEERMPESGYARKPYQNKLLGIFEELPYVKAASALYSYRSVRVQRTIYKLKYYNRPDVAETLGELWAQSLEHTLVQKPDAIIPVPLHPRKRRIRGYNQAEAFGRGIAKVWDIPVWNDLLLKHIHNTTQTKLNEDQRAKNVVGAYIPKNPERAKGMTLLIVDDVITTGSTIKECIKLLGQVEDVTVYVGAVAHAAKS